MIPTPLCVVGWRGYPNHHHVAVTLDAEHARWPVSRITGLPDQDMPDAARRWTETRLGEAHADDSPTCLLLPEHRETVRAFRAVVFGSVHPDVLARLRRDCERVIEAGDGPPGTARPVDADDPWWLVRWRRAGRRQKAEAVHGRATPALRVGAQGENTELYTSQTR